MSWMLSCIGCGTKKLPDREETRFLDFQHCLLKSVPCEVFQNERILQELILDSNQISELPRELFHCHELCILSLSDNELQILPAAVSSLINLQSLNFCKNGISDIPDSIKACKKLYRVDASTNPLCRIPEGVTQLVALRELCLNDTFLDYLPANFGRLTGLEVLELRENQLNTLPRSMTRLTSLRRLDLGQNEYFELPEVVGHLTSLTDLWFDGNKIKRIPLDIGNLTELRFIDASRNRVRDICPEIGACKQLADLYLNSNELDSLPDELCECQQLSTLCLDDNLLSQLPENLGELVQLTELNVSHNELIDLPHSIGLLRELRVFHVDHNLLTQMPPELGSCFQLIILTAAHNQITHLPPELANISRLRVINVCGNQVEFLPVSYTKLQVTGLWLSENQTKPTVPMQCKIDSPTGQKVLTCYMLPQLPYEEKVYKDDSSDFTVAEADVSARRAKSLIHFASDKGHDEPGLSRTPTPYPKELRALARHTKNLKSLNKTNSSSQNVMVPTISPVTHSQEAEQKEMESVTPEVSQPLEDFSAKLTSSENGSFSDTTQERPRSTLVAEYVDQLEVEEVIEPSLEDRQPLENNESTIDSNHITDEFTPENNWTPFHLELETTKVNLENNIGFNEINLSSFRPASIAAPERTELADAVENNSGRYNVQWQNQRPGSLAAPRNHSDHVYSPSRFASFAPFNRFSPVDLDVTYTSDHNVLSATPEVHDAEEEVVPVRGGSTNIVRNGTFNVKHPAETVDNSGSPLGDSNSAAVSCAEDGAVDANHTKIPFYSPPPTASGSSGSYGDRFSPEMQHTPESELAPTPTNTTPSKVGHQSRLPTLGGTPTKPGLLLSSQHSSEESGAKTRIPTASPAAAAASSSKPTGGGKGPTTTKTKKSVDTAFESRIPSFSAKHPGSYGAVSPVEKPINTTGIPSYSPSSRDAVTNSSLKKKTGIPLSNNKPIGHQVSPISKLQRPRGTDQAWK